jgi:hypothetical protein
MGILIIFPEDKDSLRVNRITKLRVMQSQKCVQHLIPLPYTISCGGALPNHGDRMTQLLLLLLLLLLLY